MAEYSAEERAQIARARQVQQAHEDRLLDLPGVNGIAVSLKTVNGARIPEFALIVHVTQKKPLAEVPPGEQIPPEIDGVKTDVVVGGPFYALVGVPRNHDQTTYRPVIGGSAISPDGRAPDVPGFYGTLGCVAINQDPAITDPSKQYLLLTNSHVLFKPPSVTHTGEKVGQPDTCSICSKCLDDTVAHMDHDGVLSGYPDPSAPTPGPWIDAAVATLDPGTKWVAAVIQSGEGKNYTTEPIAGIHPMDDNDRLLDQNGQHVYAVHKRGARTRDTKGWVDSIDFTPQVVYRDGRHDNNPVVLTFKSAIKIVPQAGFDAFAAYGDSGAVVLNGQSEVIGLVFGTDDETTQTGIAGVAPIAVVQDQLKVKVADSVKYPGPQTVPAPAGAHAVPAAPQPAGQLAQRFVQAEADLRATATGARLADTIRRHLPEIRDLVNTNRRVLIVWRRREGPGWLDQGLRCLMDRERPFPAELAGQPLADCAAAFSGILQAHGSAQLATDAAWLGQLLPGFAGRSYDEILALLRSRDDAAEPVALAGDR